MNSLATPTMSALLDRLMLDSEDDDQLVVRAFQQMDQHGWDAGPLQVAELLAGAALPVSRDAGRLLYGLVRSTRPALIVEFGTSFGVSTLHLAAGLRDAGTGGRLVGSELLESKARIASGNLQAAGLDDLVEIRVGDARDTLAAVGNGIGLVLLDGWKDLYLPVLHLLEPRLASGALVIADDIHVAPDQLGAYLDHVRNPANGWSSTLLEIGDGMELSTWTAT